MKKHYLIINPEAGNGKVKKVIPAIKEFYAANNIAAVFLISEYPGHAVELAASIKENNPLVVSVGGDGTLNECINGLNLTLNPLIGILSEGTGNDFIKNFSGTTEIKPALNIIAGYRDETELITSDICKIVYKSAKGAEKECLFINTIGIGFDAHVAHLMENSHILNGLPAYIVNVVKALKNYESIEAEITDGDDIISPYAKRFLICIGNGVSSGGGFYLTPNAEISDGMLDLTAIANAPKSRILQKLPKALSNQLETVKEATMYKRKTFEVKLKQGDILHIDGEVIPEPVSYIKTSICEEKIRIIKA